MMFIHCDFLGHAFLSLQQCYSSKKWKTYKLVFRVLIQKVLSMIHWFIWSLASSVLAWRIPGMEEPSGLPSMGPHRVGHDWSDLAAAAGKNRHAEEQLSPCATSPEPVLQSLRAAATEPICYNYWSPHTLEPMLHNSRSHCNEKPTHGNKE